MRRFILLVFLSLLAAGPLAMGVSAAMDSEQRTLVTSENQNNNVDSEVITEAVEQSTMLLQLKQKLAQAQYRYHVLENNIEVAATGLEEIQSTIDTLEEAIANLETLVKDNKKKILSVKSQKERKKMELEDLEEEAAILELQLEDQKALVGELMTLLYVKRDIYYEESGVNAVKVLASPETVSETLQELTYLDLIEDENQAQINKMVLLSEELTDKWITIRTKRENLDTLDTELAASLEELELELEAQEALLEETLAEKVIFENMLTSADERKEDLLREIEIYEKNVELMEEKLVGTRTLLTEEEQNLITRIEDDMATNFSVEEAADYIELDWPVTPETGLTAFFHDSSYQDLFGVNHFALDVRAQHGSPIYAPADGVVYDIVYDRDSTRYAYIMVAHRKGVMTLFGHVSEVGVSVGDYVIRGQIIGLTGATPGSVGAGVRTTGPHLHFEVWQDGVRVDPLLYLPLEEVPVDDLPEEYLKTMQDQLEQEIREIQQALFSD